MHQRTTQADAAPCPGPRGQRGSILVYLILGLVAFGTLALAGLTRFSSTVQSVLSPNCATSARYMSESGMRYAVAKLRSYSDETQLTAAIADTSWQSYTVDATRGLNFSLAITYNPSTKTASIVSTGRGCTNLAQVSTPLSNSPSGPTVNLPEIPTGPTSTGTAITGDNLFAPGGMQLNPSNASKPGITADAATNTLSLGNKQTESSGSVFFTGNNDVCASGNCTLGNGLCAYWEYQFIDSSAGDGYVWTIMSGETNTKFSNGGDEAMGELLGYGGMGSSGLGIQPPKLGVEFDIFENSGCPTAYCNAGSRCDANSKDHVAFLYWGSNTATTCPTYDDNRHGAGAGTSAQPRNSSNTSTSSGNDGYYYRTGGGAGADWMRNGTKYYYRYELDRATTPDALGLYCYQVRSWIKKSSDSGRAGMDNCTASYTGSTPEMTQVFNLDAATHNKLNKVFLGWTEGTGAATELVKLTNINIDFKSPPIVPVVPTDYVAGWTFKELSGDKAADLTGSNNGTLQGTYAWSSSGVDCPLPGVSCPNIGSIDFSGGDGYLRVPDSTSVRLTTIGTIAAWIYMDSYQDYAGIVHKGNSTATTEEAFSLQFTTNGRIALQLTSGGTMTAFESAYDAISTTGRWYHVAATWNGIKAIVYINGVQNASYNSTKAAQANNNYLLIGAQQTDSHWPIYGFNGLIDEVYLYKRALSATEIAQMALGHP